MEDTSPADVPPASLLARTTAAATRALLSANLAELAVFVLITADTSGDVERFPGSFVEDAIQIVQAAEEVLRLAVLAEREDGTTWTVLGERFETTASAVQRRFDTAVREWARFRDGRTAPDAPPSTVVSRDALTIGNIERFHQALEEIYKVRPSIDQLPRHTPASLLQALADDEAALNQAYAVPDPHRIAAIAALRAVAYEHLADQSRRVGKTDDATEYADAAEKQRQRAAAYRAQPAGAVPFEPAGPTA